MKILCVDDSSIIRKIIRGAIEVIGYDFLEAADGDEALHVLAENAGEVDLVLLDWNMPHKNGLETLKAIKSHPKYQNIPVMMVTTEAEKTNIVQAIQAGAKHYVTKPFNTEDLMCKMMECLGMGVL